MTPNRYIVKIYIFDKIIFAIYYMNFVKLQILWLRTMLELLPKYKTNKIVLLFLISYVLCCNPIPSRLHFN